MYISGGGVPNPLPAPLEVQAFHFETKTWSRLTCHADSTIRAGLSVPMGMQGRVLPNVDLACLVSVLLPMANPQLLRSASMALFRLPMYFASQHDARTRPTCTRTPSTYTEARTDRPCSTAAGR
jgi:hypothetical protein